MRPFEADAYADGWAASIAGKLRTDNPFKRPFAGAWDSYRRAAWDSGFCRCERGEKWIDPRQPRRKR